MTFTQIQDEIAERMNLTSAKSIARIGRSINEKWKTLVTSMGMEYTARGTKTADAISGDQRMTWDGVLKLYAIWDATVTPVRVLDVITFDEMRNVGPQTGNYPTQWSLANVGPTSVTVMLDFIPTSSFTLTADALIRTDTLVGDMVPNFTENFHDLLIYGGMEIEYDKQEKPEMAAKMGNRYETRLSEYRLYLAKNAYLTMVQGKRDPDLRSTQVPVITG